MTSTGGYGLEDPVRDAFAPDGVLSRAAEHFRPRSAQTEMALAVARTIRTGGALVVEAGTGVGKTFSYLVPALLSGERVLLSTATKTLQDQLFGRDLPRLVAALGLPVRTALLKGRASYLCLHRMESARQEATLPDRASIRALAKIEEWALVTRTGDLAELPGLDERSALIPLVTSTRENCLGGQCPKFRSCHVNLARREALAADVVVINHHLFFADLAVRESGMAELLPTVRVTIFDEAHQLNETGVQFLGSHLTTGQLLDFGRDMLAAGLQLARGLADWQQVVSAVERAARDLRLVVGKKAPGARLRWVDEAPDPLDPDQWRRGLEQVQDACSQAVAALATVSEIAPDFIRLFERGEELADRAQRFGGSCAPGAVRWVDVGAQLRLIESPLDIARAIQEKLLNAAPTVGPMASLPPEGDLRALGRPGAAEPAESPSRAWIFTSATLGDDARLTWFTEPCGLAQAEVLRVGSPFDYAVQAAVYVPRELARPNEPAHSDQVAALAARSRAAAGWPDDGADHHAARTSLHRGAAAAPFRSLGRDRGRGAGPMAQAAPDRALPRGQFARAARMRAGGLRLVLGGSRRTRRRAAARDHRQAALPAAGRSAGGSAGPAPGGARAQRLQRLFRAGSSGGPQAGRRAPDPARIGSGRAGGVRHAPGHHGLRPQAAGRAAADAQAGVESGV